MTPGRIAPAAVLLLASCAKLPDVPSHYCGNAVVDRVDGEECDTFGDEPGTECAPAGEPRACRFTCADRGDGTRPSCPARMGCGADGTCREATGSFAAALEAPVDHARELYAGDFDGDQRADLAVLASTSLEVLYFDEDLALADRSVTTLDAVHGTFPVPGDLSADGRLDFAVAAVAGTIGELGGPERELLPTAYPSLTLGPETTDLLVIPLEVVPARKGTEIVLLGTSNGVSALVNLEGVSVGLLLIMEGGPSSLAGGAAVANLDTQAGSPCEEIALAYAGAGEALVFSPCKETAPGEFGWNVGGALRQVALSGATVTRGPVLVDGNGDGLDDLVVEAAACADCSDLYIAYGVGDGTFHSDPSAIPVLAGDQAFALYPIVPAPLPLAMGDLNADGVPDVVTPTEVLVSVVGPGPEVSFDPRAVNKGAPWTEAVIADLNGNGSLDVLAGSSADVGVQFFNGSGEGLLNPFQIPTSGPVAHFDLGDFDGDLLTDVALAEGAPPGEPDPSVEGDALSVLFGNPTGAPSPPASLGRLDPIRQIAAGFGTDAIDGINDMTALSRSPEGRWSFAGISGRSDRLLRSPYVMVHPGTGEADYPPYAPRRLAIGELDGDGHADLAAIGQGLDGEIRLWLIPAYGAAKFAADRAKEGPALEGPGAPGPFLWARTALVALDLDTDGLDELILLGPSSGDEAVGIAAVARSVPFEDPAAVPGTRIWILEKATPIDAVIDHREEWGLAPAPNGRVRLHDVDGDGRRDLVAVALAADGPGGAATPHAVIFWNDGDGAIGPMTVVPNAGAAVLDVECLQADGTPGPEVAVLTDDGVRLASLDGRTAAAPGAAAALVAPGGRLLVAADLDVDGIDDLIVAGDAFVAVFRGKAVVP